MTTITPAILTGIGECVQLDYVPENLLPPPSAEWTRFICISDTHSRSCTVPDGDVLLHSGDLTNTGSYSELKSTMDWLTSLPHKHKIIIAGNHDTVLDQAYYERAWSGYHREKQSYEECIELLTGSRAQEAGITYLQDQKYEFQVRPSGRTWSVYGSPWSPEFCDWAFAYEREDARKVLSSFPKTDILLTHGPPFRIFDKTNNNDLPGCEALAERLPELKPRLHVFGHIHEGRGAQIHTWPKDAETPPTVQVVSSRTPGQLPPFEVDYDGDSSLNEREDLNRTVFVNAANYRAGNRAMSLPLALRIGGPGFQPIVVDLKD